MRRKPFFLGMFEQKLRTWEPTLAVLLTAFANAELLDLGNIDMRQDVLRQSPISSHGKVLTQPLYACVLEGKQKHS